MLNVYKGKHQSKWLSGRPLESDRRPWEVSLRRRKPAPVYRDGLCEREAGNGLLSHALSSIVPSALTGLTAVFGMGTGVAPSR